MAGERDGGRALAVDDGDEAGHSQNACEVFARSDTVQTSTKDGYHWGGEH